MSGSKEASRGAGYKAVVGAVKPWSEGHTRDGVGGRIGKGWRDWAIENME